MQVYFVLSLVQRTFAEIMAEFIAEFIAEINLKIWIEVIIQSLSQYWLGSFRLKLRCVLEVSHTM